MAARRPRTENPNLPTRAENIRKAMLASSDDPALTAEVKEDALNQALAATESGPRRFYSSLRVKQSPGKLRHGNTPKLVEASNEQTIEFRKEPYPHWIVMPGGTEIPVENVCGAVAVGSEIAQRASRSERLEKRKQALEEKMGERAPAPRAIPRTVGETSPRKRAGVQEVPADEDDIDDSLDEDELAELDAEEAMRTGPGGGDDEEV